MLIRDACPACGLKPVQEKWLSRHGTQNQQCQACERQLSATADDRRIAEARRTMIAPLLRERISLRGLCRAVGGSLPWLLHCMVERCAACPDD